MDICARTTTCERLLSWLPQVVDVGATECLFVISIEMHGSRWTAMVIHHRNPSSYIAIHRAVAEKLLMTKLASHLRLSRHGVYYYRVGIARQNRGKNPGFCVSLRTCDRRVAATLSYNITARLAPFRQVLRVNPDAENAGGGVGIDLMIREVKEFVQRCVARLRDGDASALAEPVANDVAALVDQTLVLEHQRTAASATAAPLVPATLSAAGSQDVPAIFAQAFSQALLTAVQALKAEAVTPAPSAPPPPIRLAGWDEAIAHWEGENAPSWAAKTKLDFPSAVRALRNWCLQQGIGSPQQVTAEIMAEYKVYLATQYPNVRKRKTGQLGLGLATINKHLAAASSFFAAPKRARCYLGHELPTKGLLYPRRKVRSKARPPLKLQYEEIAGLFEPATFLAWARKPHDRWVPLILLYHGLRVSEACQLSTDDLRNPRGRWLLSVTDECENAVMKTAATRRTVPLHPALVELGLPAYAADVRRLFGDGLLFPYLSGQSKNGYGDVPGESLNKY